MIIESGQVWEYTDQRTDWSYLLILLEHRESTENFDAFILDWDEGFEVNGPDRVTTVGMWELRTYFKLIE